MTGMHPQNRLLGYARVSTYGQTLDAQLDQLRGAGCAKIYREKVTGAHNDRRELLKMLDHLAPGDVVTVTRIDRLCAQHRRPVRYRQAHRGRQGAVSILGRAVGRQHRQHRALDDCRSRRAGGRGARSDPPPAPPRAAAGPRLKEKHVGRLPSLTPEQQKEVAKRQRRRDAAGIGKELRCQQGDDFTARANKCTAVAREAKTDHESDVQFRSTAAQL